MSQPSSLWMYRETEKAGVRAELPAPNSPSDGTSSTVRERATSQVTGQVVDATGGTVEGAQLSARTLLSEQEIAHAVSDAEGRFELAVPPGALRISASADEYSTDHRDAQAPARGVLLVLAPASVIFGLVRSRASSAGLPGVMVSAEGRNGQYARSVARTDGEGNFELPALAAGGYAIRAVSPEWRSSEHWIRVGVGDAQGPLQIDMDPATSLTGLILVEGRPCEQGVLVLSGPVYASVPSAADGSVSYLGLLPGEYSAEVSCGNALPLLEQLQVGQGAVSRRWELERGLIVRGSVKRFNGEPLVNARVALQSEADSKGPGSGPRRVECTSDSNGEFACDGLSLGSYTASLTDLDGEAAKVLLSEAGAPRVELRAAASGSLRVVVQGRSGERAMARARDPSGRILAGVLSGGVSSFENIPLGEYCVFVGDSACSPARLASDGELVDLSLAAPDVASIAGRVVDDRGQAVPDAWVHASMAQSVTPVPSISLEPVLSDDTGGFFIPRLVPGKYDLEITSPNGEVELADVPAGARNVLVRVDTWGSLSGVVETESGSPVPTFILDYESGASTDSVRGSQGHWSLPWLAPGEYRLRVGAAERVVMLQPGARQVVRITVPRAVELATAH
ncbi:MAG: carboxypeptidase-like regulatory domain-containing protein [Deltaproteobacteria bacterium]